MNRHINEIMSYVPDLLARPILDLGAGKGKFMMEITKMGGDVSGIEPYQKYIDQAREEAVKNGLKLKIRIGSGEHLPYKDGEFGFVNMTEVIEHVQNPLIVMKEVFRVLGNEGKVYVSVPNRFGLKDQHFNLYFVNWLPRTLSDRFISIFGKHKDYSGENGLQRLKEMHYMTFGKAKNFFEFSGFQVGDIRELKLNRRFKGLKRFFLSLLYKFLRFWYFDSFHFFLYKNN